MKKRKKRIVKRIFLFFFLLLAITSAWYYFYLKKQVDAVNQWSSEVDIAVEENDISQYKDIAMAIIFTETKGNQLDIMQSSESQHGEQGKITSSKESIDSGVAFLAQAIHKSEENGLDIWVAVQAYNFGLSYIDYVKENGGKTSVQLADEYSKNQLAPMLGNSTGEKYQYLHPQSLFYNGGYLYKNGGNFFYADLVKWNKKVLDTLE